MRKIACNCKHAQIEIYQMRNIVYKMREFFYKRLTVDSEHHDARRKDFNQALFIPESDEYFPGAPCWDRITVAMIMKAFDNAQQDYHNTFCDVKNYKRPKWEDQ